VSDRSLVYRCSHCGLPKKGHVCVFTGQRPPSSYERSTRREINHAEARANGDVRLGWTRDEDEIILSSVNDHGPKWVEIAQQLPGRTEHAARNRYHRLISRSAAAESDSMMRSDLYPPQPDVGYAGCEADK